MFGLIKKYKREFVYISYLFLIFELLVTPQFILDIRYFFLTAIIGYILINIWLINTYKLHAYRKISKYSEVLLKVNVLERLFSYVLLPLLFYFAIVVYILFSSSILLNQIVIVISLFLFFYLFLYVRTSYEKVYYINKMTRVVYDFISIAVFFLISSVVMKSGLGDIYVSILIFLISILSFVYVLLHHRKLEISSFLVSFASSAGIAGIIFLLGGFSFNAKSAIVSILYYLVVAVWNVRFGGARKFSDYIPPVMFAIMALILVLST